MTRVPVGRRNLFSERRRAYLGIAGVGAALLLMLAVNGIYDGAIRQITRYIDTSPADVFVSQRGVRNMHMTTSSLPASAVRTIRALPGVEWAYPILLASDSLGTPGGRQLSYVIGYEPGSRGGPVSLVEGAAPGPGEIVVDDRAAAALDLDVGGTIETLGRTWRVSGLASGLTNIANTVAFVRFEDFAAARGLSGVASYVLVGGGGSPQALAAAIERSTGLTALSRADFAAQERRLVQDMAAGIMRIMTFAALLIGLAVVGLTLYAATLSKLREVGVMKALGARRGRLARIVLAQAAWTVGAALVVSALLALGLSWVLGRGSANVSLVLEGPSLLFAGAGAAVLGALGAIAPLIRVARVDPATVFRR